LPSLLEQVSHSQRAAREAGSSETALVLHPPKHQGTGDQKDVANSDKSAGQQANAKGGPQPQSAAKGLWASRKSELWNVGKFWLIMSSLVLAPYVTLVLMQKNRRQEQEKFLRTLRVAAISFHKQPLQNQIICTGVAFFISDVVAQTTKFYFEDTYLKGSKGIDLRWTLIVTATSVLLQVGALQQLLNYVDKLWGYPQTSKKAIIKMGKMQAVFLFAYLPVAILLFATVACFVFRSIADAFEHCGPSVVVHIPRNFGNGALLAFERLPGDYLQAAFFWPASHIFNYVLMQRWAPEMRPVWDSVVVLCWNVFVRFGPAEKEAVGPVLFGGVPAPRQKVPPGIDCKRHSITAWGVWSWQKAKQGSYFCWVKFKDFVHYCWTKFKAFCAWLWKWTRIIAAWIWKWTKIIGHWLRQHVVALLLFLFDALKYLVLCVLWILAAALMGVLTLLRLALYWVLAILKGALKVVLTIVDFIKKCLLVLFFIPDTAGLVNGCFYCFVWPSKGQWPLEFVKQNVGPFPASKFHIRSWTPQKY